LMPLMNGIHNINNNQQYQRKSTASMVIEKGVRIFRE